MRRPVAIATAVALLAMAAPAVAQDQNLEPVPGQPVPGAPAPLPADRRTARRESARPVTMPRVGEALIVWSPPEA